MGFTRPVKVGLNTVQQSLGNLTFLIPFPITFGFWTSPRSQHLKYFTAEWPSLEKQAREIVPHYQFLPSCKLWVCDQMNRDLCYSQAYKFFHQFRFRLVDSSGSSLAGFDWLTMRGQMKPCWRMFCLCFSAWQLGTGHLYVWKEKYIDKIGDTRNHPSNFGNRKSTWQREA